jgi:hypothetical protein
MSVSSSTKRTRQARFEPLDATRIAPGMFEVRNLRRESTHTVDIREQACDCEDFQYRMGPAEGQCYHLRFVQGIADGEFCCECGYEHCRPSCPRRGE